MTWVVGFLATRLGRYVGIGCGLLALFVAFVGHERNIGAKTVTAKIEANNNAVSKKADTAARKSADPRAIGLLNPNYRAD